MEPPDARGAGGRAPRGSRGATPGKIMGLVASPLQIISKTVKGLVSPNDGTIRAGAAGHRPSPPLQSQQARPAIPQLPKVVEVQKGFSFPTVAGCSESPPTNPLSRSVPMALSTQPRVEQPGEVPTRTAPLDTGALTGTARDFMSGWSPSKLASLNFFMNGTKLGADITQPTVPVSKPNPSDSSEPCRPYFNLTSMLRAGPGGLISGAGGPPGSGVSRPARGTTGSTVGSQRYNPYGRPNLPRPPRPGTAMLPHSQSQQGVDASPASANLPDASHTQLTQAQPSLAVANARLPPPNPRVAPPPSGKAPRPPTAPGAVRLAPGQVAFSSGRTGTPLPKFGATVAAGQPQPVAHTPGGFRTLAGAVSGKRQRDSPAASPLMASGIRNLSEFKRRRQGSTQQQRTVLANLSSRTPRDKTPVQSDGERTPGGNGSGGSEAAATPGPPSASGAGGDVPATEAARRILETLDNFKRTGDNTRTLAAKSCAPPTSRSAPPTGSPFPGPFMPPLDRLDHNHYGGTPTPSITTGVAGFGATPSPLANAMGAAQTPGPRMVLEFKTPVALERQLDGNKGAPAASTDGGTGTLPLSPIAVPPVAAADSVDQGANATASFALSAEAEARKGADAVLAPGSSAAAGVNVAAAETTGASSVPTFSFSLPSTPCEPQLRAAKDICGANVASASSSGMKVFVFGAATSVSDAAALVVGASPAGADARAGSHVASEVAKAAAVPLPDDDEDEAEEAEEIKAAPVAAEQTAVDTRPHLQASKSAASVGAKRVAFAEPLPSDGHDVDLLAKGAAAAVAATPPATPGGVFFSAHAGSTPFRPSTAEVTPAIFAGDKTVGGGDKADTQRPAALSFEAAVVAAAAPADVAKPVGFSFGQASSPSFTFGAPLKHAADAPVADSGKAEAASAGGDVVTDKAPAASVKSAQPPSIFNPSPAVPAAAPPACAPIFGQTTVGAATTSASTSTFAFGGAASAPTTSPASVPAPSPVEAPAPQTTNALFGGENKNFGNSATPTSSAPANKAPTFRAVSTSAPAAAPVAGFTFNAPPANSTPASSSAVPSAPSVASGPSFTFSGASAGAGAPPASFGSPMPIHSSSAAPMFGTVQPVASAVGFGSGNFGAASGPAVTFTFGAQPATASSDSAATGSADGFGAQLSGSNPASTFSFGQNASASAFGASAPAPVFGTSGSAPAFGAAPAQQTSFGTGTPVFGAAASANPFAAAAPSFAAPSTQPTFSSALAGTAPAFGASAAPTIANPGFGGFGSSNGGAQTPAAGMFTFGGVPAVPFGSTQPAPTAAPTFGQTAPSFGQQGQAAAPTFGSAPFGFGTAQAFGGAPVAAPPGDTGGGFSLGLGDPKDGRKRVKARRHGH